MATQYTEFYVTVTVDEGAEWDGDFPLDENKTWTPYVVALYGRKPECPTCNECGEDEMLDCLGGVWASDDMAGRDYIETCIRELDTGNGQPLPDIDDLDVRYE